MLFSGSIRSYKCTDCSSNISDVIPTSIIPIILVLFISGVCWLYSLELLLNNRLLALIIALIINIGTFLLVFYVIDKLMHKKIHQLICPSCGGKLEALQGGFYDGSLPSRMELIIYLVTIMLPASIAAFLKLF